MAKQVVIASAAVESDFQESAAAKALALVDEAGRRGADIVCLPECCGSPCTAGKWDAVAVPGPAVDPFAALAAKYRMYVILPLLMESGREKPYNAALLLDRSGRIAGHYCKTHLCLPDHGEGQTMLPGEETPVFSTDFGPIAITICMDIHYPELYGVLALKGAKIIFWPTGAMDYTGDLIESLVNARAVDNQVFLVPSHFVALPYLVGKSYGRSRIVDCMGRIRADTGHFPGLAIASVDLEQTYPMWYTGPMLAQYPTMEETLRQTRRPELYGELVKPLPARTNPSRV